MAESTHIFDRYLRRDKLPHMWCPGCGNGIVLQSIIRAVDRVGLKQSDVVFVAGIGCSGRGNSYVDFNGTHTNHGRAIAYATGMKMQNPKLKIIVITGDGDCTSIGGNHFIHGARRNIDMTVVCFNNSNYGMTGGQYSPVTPEGAKTKTSVYGNIEPHFDVCDLAKASGATYVARATTYHVNQLIDYIAKGIEHKGFSVIDAMCDCPTLFGRLNKKKDAVSMMEEWKEKCVSIKQAEKMTEEELEGKILIGEFVSRSDRPEYTEKYDGLIESLKER